MNKTQIIMSSPLTVKENNLQTPTVESTRKNPFKTEEDDEPNLHSMLQTNNVKGWLKG